jgi:hypothetical protein
LPLPEAASSRSRLRRGRSQWPHLQEGGTSLGPEQTTLQLQRGSAERDYHRIGCDGGNVRVAGDGERRTLQARPSRLDDVGRCALASHPIDGETALGVLVASGKGWNFYLSFSVEGAKVTTSFGS